jgi:hypothetical protein
VSETLNLATLNVLGLQQAGGDLLSRHCTKRTSFRCGKNRFSQKIKELCCFISHFYLAAYKEACV